MTEKIPTWGYRPGKARIFELAPGEKLPPGWSDTMPKGEHPHEIESAPTKGAPVRNEIVDPLEIPPAFDRRNKG